MKLHRWACCSARLRGLLVGCAFAFAAAAGAAAAPETIEPVAAQVLISDDSTPPAQDQPGWQPVTLPDAQEGTVAWYRVSFDAKATGEDWMLYLPYFYGGGRVWLNGTQVAAVTESSPTLHVRWERPLLLPLPSSSLRAGANVLHLRVRAQTESQWVLVPQLVIGPQAALQAQFDRRLLFVRMLPIVTVSTGVVAALFMIFIWLKRRQEVAYGLFGVAALLWALRTTTFVFDAMPLAAWPYWRALYYTSTGGFIAVLALFALSIAGWLRRGAVWALVAYVALGPMLYLAGGPSADGWVGRWWVLGLIPMGFAVAAVTFATAWRTPSAGAGLVFAAVLLALLAGIRDYSVGFGLPWFKALLPAWSGHRIFLLHHAANILLIVMGCLLAVRFVRSLRAVEQANVVLEQRIADRERELAAGYERIAAMQREQAMQEERQRIMQELHDGVGAQLVGTLMRAQRGVLTNPAMSDAMRGAIDEMRVAIEALAGDDGDLRTAFGNFRFRWDARLREAGLTPRWEIELPDEPLTLPPHDTLQLLRVAQEALVNVLKHANATRVRVRLEHSAGQLRLEVADDGLGLTGASGVNGVSAASGAANGAQSVPNIAGWESVVEGGRGLTNMRARAARLNAQFIVASGADGRPGAALPGLHLALVMPLA